jgi:Histidine kinase-, DNA gyrase B-, and HSP90-like ATPase
MKALQQPVEITPSAAALIESLRGLGYSPETAVADLIDNSIAANAESIELDANWNGGNPVIALLDDGDGMDRPALAEALRFGGRGPLSTRNSSDLGRFGLGLKTASLSQCRRLTVVSRKEGKTAALVLDVDVVREKGWYASTLSEFPEHPFVAKLFEWPHGTLVRWDRMDGLGGLSSLDKETFYLRLQDIRAHLGMVFHRFLDGDARRIHISTNGRRVKSWDPFQRDHPATIEMRSRVDLLLRNLPQPQVRLRASLLEILGAVA